MTVTHININITHSNISRAQDNTTCVNITNPLSGRTTPTSGQVPYSTRVIVPQGISFGYVDIQFVDLNGAVFMNDVVVTQL